MSPSNDQTVDEGPTDDTGLSAQLQWAAREDAADLAILQAACNAGSPVTEAWSPSDWDDLLTAAGVLAVHASAQPRAEAVDPSQKREPGAWLVGFALTRVVLDEAELYAVGVKPDWRRQGLATVLLNAAFSGVQALGARTLFLEVARSNAAARALYGTLGFQTVGERPGYYRQGNRRESALVLAKRLTSGGGHDASPRM